MRRFPLWVPSAILVVAAQATAQAPTRRDSAGITIISTGSRAKAPVAFELGAKPVVDLGGLEDQNPDLEFKPTQGYLRGVRFSDGGFAVIDEVRIQFFDKAGKREKIVGRSGAGPEEFQYIISICRSRGDSLIVSDSRNRRMTIVTRSGQVVRTIAQDSLGAPGFNACFDDGTFLVNRRMAAAPGTPVPMQLIRRRLDGSVVNVVTEVTNPPLDMVTQMFTEFVVQGEFVYVGPGLPSEVRAFAAGGGLKRILRTADASDPITDDEAEERLRRTIPRNTSQAEVASRMDRMRSLRTATHWPTYRTFLVAPDGTTWFNEYDKSMTYPAPAWWTAVDAGGRILGRLMIPAPKQGQQPLQVITFGTNDVLVRRQDDDGAAHLTLYPLVKK